VTPTRVRLLVGVALVVGLLTWAVLRVVEARSGSLPDVPWTVPATLALLAAAMFVTVLTLRPRLRRRPGAKPLPPLVAARFAALALASSRAGAAVAGAYLGFAAVLAGDLEVAYNRERAISALLAAAASGALVVAALFLERACRIPEPPPDDRPGGGRLGSAA
jgi:hypothetical protein